MHSNMIVKYAFLIITNRTNPRDDRDDDVTIDPRDVLAGAPRSNISCEILPREEKSIIAEYLSFFVFFFFLLLEPDEL